MRHTQRSTTLTVTIAAEPEAVYRFASEPANLPRWAPAFARSIAQVGDRWMVETADGPVAVAFAAPNALGVLDHTVELPSGQSLLVPMRVVANGQGSEVLFTLMQPAEMPLERHLADIKLVERDLNNLKTLLEQERAG